MMIGGVATETLNSNGWPGEGICNGYFPKLRGMNFGLRYLQLLVKMTVDYGKESVFNEVQWVFILFHFMLLVPITRITRAPGGTKHSDRVRTMREAARTTVACHTD